MASVSRLARRSLPASRRVGYAAPITTVAHRDGPPLRVYGSAISYFTGKLEAYLRYKEIPYERVAMSTRYWNRVVPRATGVAQMPAIELPDGRWMTDTTPIIAWFEAERPEPRVVPADPLQAFASRFVEDYADEWMWRPAMHYRWSHRPDAMLLSDRIVSELLGDVPAPAWLKRWGIRRRQFGGYVRGDGVTARTRAHVEGIYLRTLASLEGMLATRPFLLGGVPTLADFGFFASMFRHFGIDPTPSAIMRERAPGVYAWLARLWNARGSRLRGALLPGVPADWGPILDDAGAAYLPYLCANAEAWREGRRRFDVTIQGTDYVGVMTSRYRVWCLEELRRHFEALRNGARDAARALLERHGCWEPLWRVRDVRSGHDPERRAPFARGLKVF
jgi:glutathione S-transferase